MKLRQTALIVRDLLIHHPMARNSDAYLYYLVCERMNKDVLSLPFGFVLDHMDELCIPPFETVRRTRQKMQSKYPNLCAKPTVEAIRAVNEEEYRRFALS